MNKIRLLIIEDDYHNTKKIRLISKSNNKLMIISAGSLLKDTLLKIKELNPHIVLVDINLKSESCLSVIKIIKRDKLAAKIIVTGLEKDQEDLLKYIQSGINGLILNESSPKEIVSVINKVESGMTVLPPLLINKLFTQITEYSHQRPNLALKENYEITNRESQVIQFLSEGLSNREIGKKMHISTYTVKSHIHNIMEKFSVHTRLEIANHSFNSTLN